MRVRDAEIGMAQQRGEEKNVSAQIASAANSWYDAADLAAALGVAPRTVQTWIRRGWLRGRRKGRIRSRWRFRAADLESAIIAAALRTDKRPFRSMCRRGMNRVVSAKP